MYIFIVNPMAGNGRGKKVFEKLKQSSVYLELQASVYVTTYKGHAEKIASEINMYSQTSIIKTIIVIGGDGTMHEVVNGLSENSPPISFIPAGSGNDFSRGTNQPKDPLEILQNIVHGKALFPYWIGKATTEKHRSFVNCIGFGFDARVVQRANRSSLKNFLNKIRMGRLIYVFSLLRELFHFRPFQVKIKTDEMTKTFDQCLFLTVNNQPYFGGGMKINPTAENNHDYFSVVVVDSISKWKVLFLFITVFFGKHTHFKEVNLFNTRKVIIETENPTLYQIDGELDESSYAHIEKNPLPLQIKGIIK